MRVVAIDPSVIRDDGLRQILTALVENQRLLFSTEAVSSAVTPDSIGEGVSLRVRKISKTKITASTVAGGVSSSSEWGDVLQVVNSLVQQNNNLVRDLQELVAEVQGLKTKIKLLKS